jgi:DNA-binding MarR family transcriptional regulator
MGSCQDESIGRLIYKTSQIMRNYAEKLLNPYDLTVEQFHLLKQTSLDNGISQNKICQLVEKKPANITRILDRLEKKKWVRRQPNPSDRRSSLVFLTEEGERIIDEVSSLFESYSGWFVEGISLEDEAIFRSVLEKINNNLNKLTDEISQ